MNASPPLSGQIDESAWSKAADGVNAWRGGCLQNFAKVESAVSETLEMLSTHKKLGAKIRLRHLVGQRMEDLAAAVGPDGPFAKEGKAAAKVLQEYRDFAEPLRTYLAHGLAKVTLDRGGKWVVILRYVTIRARQLDRPPPLVHEECHARDLLAELQRKSDRLCAILGNLRRGVS